MQSWRALLVVRSVAAIYLAASLAACGDGAGGTPIGTHRFDLAQSRAGGRNAGSGISLSGTIDYSGSQGPVSATRPIFVIVFATPDFLGDDPLDFAVVTNNGGEFDLAVPAAGTYYLAYVLDVNNNSDVDVGEPAAIYNDRGSPPGDPISAPRSGLSLEFNDDHKLNGISGTVTYTGALSGRQVIVEVFTDANLGVLPDWSGSQDAADGGPGPYRYKFITLDRNTYYLRGYFDLDGNYEFDPGEPFTIYSDKNTPPGDPVVAGAAQTEINLTFGDENAVLTPTPTPTITSSPTRVPTVTQTPTPARTPTVTPTRKITCPGDADCDAQLTAADVAATIRALFDPIARALCSTDCDEDGAVKATDILCVSKDVMREAGCV